MSAISITRNYILNASDREYDMRKIEFLEETVNELDRERFEHPHPEVRRRMMVVWLWSQGFNQQNCAIVGGISERTVRRYLDGFEEGGLAWLRALRWGGPTQRLASQVDTLEEEFTKNPPWSVAEALERIKALTGIDLKPTQVRTFLHSLGLKWRKIAAIPVPPKKTIEEHVATQQEFLDHKLEPALAEAQAEERHVFFVDAAHFVLGMFLCNIWSHIRMFIRSSSGRQRFNVLGAWNAVTHQFISVCNTTVINQETFKELLQKIADLDLVGPITLVLDNARYQHCAACIEYAKKLGIELMFLPAYSPNLNLIERIWKFVKKECLYGQHFISFHNFRSRIENCLDQFDSIHKNKLNSLMTLNFQTFEDQIVIHATA
jgi:transposase